YFKKVKESNKKRPEDSKTCPYFHQLDALYRSKAALGSPGAGAAAGVHATPSPAPQGAAVHVTAASPISQTPPQQPSQSQHAAKNGGGSSNAAGTGNGNSAGGGASQHGASVGGSGGMQMKASNGVVAAARFFGEGGGGGVASA